jgi:hypothetical protein
MNDLSNLIPPIIWMTIWMTFWFVLTRILRIISYWWAGKGQREAWKEFAVTNKLHFHPGIFLMRGTRIDGVYRKHNLRIAAAREGRRTCGTRVKLKANSPCLEQDEGNVGDTFTSPTPEDVLSLLTPTGLQGVYFGKMETVAWGEFMWYWQGDALTDVDNLRRVCNLLADVADHYSAVVSIGGTVVHPLEAISRQRGLLSSVARQMLHDIARRTQRRLGHQSEHLLCPRCLARCGAHRADLEQFDETYYGCRLCRQSREFIDCPQGVVAVLDSAWTDAQAQSDGLLRVNWLARRALFDFDRVEIVRAADEDVERFAVQVGNDTDPLRSPRYAEMGCAVGPACGLSENTLRVLESTFGQVRQIVV